ncbi:hypothetical protein KSC_063350 [Ktedonobacter sp. SOSP1-52]|uniref:ATP-binding protein n=1 Tax=Ktedonobacter sp. SOSP1-52 TaxID=2778366 RepID=UPI0019161828|nr:ATP-binding protein [Ktedonobacter sp. SOSP1-52]GHO67443.1 hypothetical protein KSC_063350 [Ktedonobacter sp. SOSP1-52]
MASFDTLILLILPAAAAIISTLAAYFSNRVLRSERDTSKKISRMAEILNRDDSKNDRPIMEDKDLLLKLMDRIESLTSYQNYLEKTVVENRHITLDLNDMVDEIRYSMKALRDASVLAQEIKSSVRELSQISSSLSVTSSEDRTQVAIRDLRELAENLSRNIVPADHISSQPSKISESSFGDKLLIYQQISNEFTHVLGPPIASAESAVGNVKEKFVTVLRENGVQSKEAKLLLSSLDNAALSLQMVKTILQHGAGFFPGVAERFSVEMLIRKAVRMVTVDAQERVEPTIYADNIPEVKYYPANLLMALMSVLENAYQEIGFDGKIRIDVRADSLNKNISIDISNNGKPIPPQDQDKIFMPGFTTKKTGRGIGLSIARKCLASVNGKIDLALSKQDQTTFKIEFKPEEVY